MWTLSRVTQNQKILFLYRYRKKNNINIKHTVYKGIGIITGIVHTESDMSRLGVQGKIRVG